MEISGPGLAVPQVAGVVLSPAPPVPLTWAVFDLETSGLEHPNILVACVWSSRTNWVSLYFGHQSAALASLLESVDVVVSFNGQGFDKAVIEEQVGRRLRLKHHIDLYLEITNSRPAFERGWKLDDISARLWGIGKPLESSKIPEMWLTGMREEVIGHCLNDVYLTRSLLEQVRDTGWVVGPDNSNVEVACPIWWNRMTSQSGCAPNVPVISL